MFDRKCAKKSRNPEYSIEERQRAWKNNLIQKVFIRIIRNEFIRSLTLFLVLILIAPVPSFPSGETNTIPRKITLAEAESLLLQRNLVVTAARYQVDASRAGRLIASYKPNPVFTIGAEQIPFYSPLQGSYPRFFSTNPDAGANPVYTLRIDKITERGGKRRLRTALADFQIKVNEAQMLDAIRTQLFQLRQAFTTAMLAKENMRLAVNINQQYGQTEVLTQTKVENGELPGAELYRVRAGRLQYQQAVLQARTSYEQAVRDVLNVLGAKLEEVEPVQPVTKDISGDSLSTGRLGDLPKLPNSQTFPEFMRAVPLEVLGNFDDLPVLQEPGELRRTALDQRPDVIAARNSLESANRAWLLAKAQRARDLDIGYEYQRVGDDSTLGVVVQIPLFLYNNQKAAITQANAQLQATETLLHQAENQAATDVEKAYQAYLSARSALALYNSENLVQVEKMRGIAEYSFKEGAVSLLELLDAQRTYNQTLTAYNQARFDYQMSLWQLEQAIGGPLR